MKEIFQQYATYHAWANLRMIDRILLLPEEQQTKEVPSSFKSLFATLKHVWDAESIWWQRMKMQEVVTPPGLNFTGSVGDVTNALLQQDRLWLSWVNGASIAAIQHVFHYQNSKREQFRQPIWQMLLQIFNHGTYHRGQLVNILRQLEIDDIPSTDFIVWSRNK